MNRTNVEHMLDNHICLIAHKGNRSLIVKQLEDGTYLLVTVEIDRKRSRSQTTENVETTLSMMEAFAPWDDWHMPDV